MKFQKQIEQNWSIICILERTLTIRFERITYLNTIYLDKNKLLMS